MKNTIVVAVMSAVIGGLVGWYVNGWRLESKFATAQISAIEQYEELQREANERYVALEQESLRQREALMTQVTTSRALAKRLDNELKTLELNKRELNIEEVVLDDSEECPGKVVVANPIGDQFVRMWNSSARGTDADRAGED